MNGSSNNYYDKTFYTALGRERYVQMSKINLIINLNKTITVAFDENGGNCTTTSKEVTYNSTYGRLPDASKSGREFAGWYTSKSGGNKVTSASKVTEMQAHTLYARWKSTVTFNPNGGVCDISSLQVIEGNKYGDLPVPTRTGYTFDGWYTAQTGGSNVTATTTVPDKGNYTLYAHWIPALYMVTFDANGGSCTTSNKQVTYDSTYGTLPTPTRTGYTFNGWYTAASGGNKIISSTKVTNAQSHTIYAHWTQITYTISYNANGGNGAPNSQTKTHGVDLTLSGAKPTRTGYTFLGWSTNKSATTATYAAGGKYTANSGATLYAVWTKTTYIISYNANGGSGAPNSQIKTYGVDLTLSSKKPTRSGYTFLGWGTSNSATTTTYQPGGKYTANSRTTLYAVWQQVIEVTNVTLNLTADQWIPLKNSSSAGTLSLTATVAPSNATNKNVTWTSSNTSVAIVSNGSVTAKGAGLTTITASAGGKSASVNVYVYNAVMNGGTSYYLCYSNGKQASGTINAGSGGAKLVLEWKGNSLWYIRYKYNATYNTWGTVDDYLSASSTLNKYFTNYGAY